MLWFYDSFIYLFLIFFQYWRQYRLRHASQALYHWATTQPLSFIYYHKKKLLIYCIAPLEVQLTKQKKKNSCLLLILKKISWVTSVLKFWPTKLCFSKIISSWIEIYFVSQSIIVFILINAQFISSLATGRHFKLATGSFWYDSHRLL